MDAFLRGIEEFQGVFARNAEQLLDLLSSCEASLTETCRLNIFRKRVEHDANEIIGTFTACCIALNRRWAYEVIGFMLFCARTPLLFIAKKREGGKNGGIEKYLFVL